MYKHHNDTIENVTERFKKQDGVLALLVGGSVAHGFALESSDVDIMIIITDEDYKKRLEAGEIHYFDREDCTYEQGYIDGKYISIDFLKKVAQKGSEPARYAFDGAIICFSKFDGLEELLKSITRYPVESKNELIRRFFAQFAAWKWYSHEAIKHNNKYLLNHSVSNLILFGGRMILAYNEKLYPYHKWFRRVLQDTPNKPDDLMEKMDDLLECPTGDKIEAFNKCIFDFVDWGITDLRWPNQFMIDSELTWMEDKVPIADI